MNFSLFIFEILLFWGVVCAVDTSNMCPFLKVFVLKLLYYKAWGL